MRHNTSWSRADHAEMMSLQRASAGVTISVGSTVDNLSMAYRGLRLLWFVIGKLKKYSLVSHIFMCHLCDCIQHVASVSECLQFLLHSRVLFYTVHIFTKVFIFFGHRYDNTVNSILMWIAIFEISSNVVMETIQCFLHA